MRIRVGDMVEVIAGNDRGMRARVLRVDREAGKIVVEGVNRATKHVRRSQKNPQGGRLQKEMPISVSNVKLVCPSTGLATRIGVRIEADGSKVRVCKKSGAVAGVISPAKKKKS
jgi:large subunit ribosomal protein L24